MPKTIAKSVLNILQKSNVKFEIIEHRQVFTAHDKAATTGIDPKQVAKSVVLKADTKDYILVSVPANKNLDLKKIKDFINKTRQKEGGKLVKKIDFAKEAWAKKNLKNSDAGSLLPLGNIYKLPNFIDSSLLKQKFIVLNSGSNWQSLKITPAQFIKLEKEYLQKGSFAMPRPKKRGRKK